MSLYALGVIILSILFERVINNFSSIKNFASNATKILSPFIIGFFMAYLINPLVRFLENKVFKRIKYLTNKKGLLRGLSLGSAYILTITLIIWLISYLLPEMASNAISLIKVFPDYMKSLKNNFDNFIREYPSISYEIESYVNSLLDIIVAKSASISAVLNSTVTYFISGTVSLASKLLNFIIGIIISIYVILDKEKFSKQCKKVIYTILSKSSADKIMSIVYDSNKAFEGFLVGKIIDSTIIGIICFLGLTMLNIPYTLLLSIIVGITNMIPYFGPFIGAIPSIFITIAAAGFFPALWVAIFILILQQFDGNILGPKILGDSTGLSPFWIIFSVTVGGALGGVLGMFLGVPIFAVIYIMFSRFINRKYNEKTELTLADKDDN